MVLNYDLYLACHLTCSLIWQLKKGAIELYEQMRNWSIGQVRQLCIFCNIREWKRPDYQLPQIERRKYLGGSIIEHSSKIEQRSWTTGHVICEILHYLELYERGRFLEEWKMETRVTFQNLTIKEENMQNVLYKQVGDLDGVDYLVLYSNFSCI